MKMNIVEKDGSMGSITPMINDMGSNDTLMVC